MNLLDFPGRAHRLQWPFGSAEVWPLGGTAHHVAFTLPDGRTVRPLAEASWHDDPATTGDESIPAHLRWLGGEWPCVPFGKTSADPIVHGHGTDNCWRFDAADDGAARLSIDYPAGHAIARLQRSIACVADRPALDFTLTVHARADFRLPVGLHPIVRLPDAGKGIALDAAFSHGETFPAVFETAVSRLAVGERFGSLGSLPLTGGGEVSLNDLAHLRTEEAAQLFGVDGVARVVWPDEGYALRLTWDPTDFPTLLLWLSAGGRLHNPWGGRFRGLGVEPLDAVFEAPDGVASIGGGRRFSAGEVWSTSYRIEAEAL